MEINLLFKIAAIRNTSSSITPSTSKSRKRRSSNDDNTRRTSNSPNNGSKRNKHIIQHSKDNIQSIGQSDFWGQSPFCFFPVLGTDL